MKNNKMCAILGNEHEYTELLPLTKRRALATLYFDCKYRIMDFALSSIVNANIRNIFLVVNQAKLKSYFDHLGGGREWGLDSIGSYRYINFSQDLVRQKVEGQKYFDDVIDYLEKSRSTYTVFVSNKMLNSVDLKAVLKIHKAQKNDMTVVFKRMPKDKIASDDQILEIDDQTNRVKGNHNFSEYPHNSDIYNLSMNIFIIETQNLINQLRKGQRIGASANLEDFFLSLISRLNCGTYEYTGYMCNIFDVKSYYDANMDMLNVDHMNSLLYSSQHIITRTKNEVATHFTKTSDVKNSQFATGCVVEGYVRNSLVSRRTFISENSKVEDSIIMSNAHIGKDVEIKYAILDKDVVVKSGVKIIGTPENPVVIEKKMKVTSDVIQDTPREDVED